MAMRYVGNTDHWSKMRMKVGKYEFVIRQLVFLIR